MKKILCVDDEQNVLKVIRQSLGKRGYEVVTTDDPTRLSEFLAEKPDLVTLDIQMPVRDGFDLFEELRRSGSPPPILFVTGHPEAFAMDSNEKMELWMSGFADGNTDILYKPFTLETLYEKVESLIGPP